MTVSSDEKQIDALIGQRLRLRRTLLGLTQGQLGDKVGITFQQVQKYERGSNRMGGSRLYQFSHILGVPVAFFFEELESPSENDDEALLRRSVLELSRNFTAIKDPTQRRLVSEFAKTLAA